MIYSVCCARLFFLVLFLFEYQGRIIEPTDCIRGFSTVIVGPVLEKHTLSLWEQIYFKPNVFIYNRLVVPWDLGLEALIA